MPTATKGLPHRSTINAMLTRKNRIPNVLQKACKNATNYIALGMYQPMLNSLFHHFTDWSQIDNSRIAPLGEKSVNGFVLKLPFETQQYTAHTILKSAANAGSDNLVYEYLVGTKFINSMCTKFPCFLETYSLNKYKHAGFLYAAQTNANGMPRFPSIPFQEMMTSATVNWQEACKNSQLFAVLIQYFDNVVTFRNAIRNQFDNVKYDVPQLWYQVYYTLDTLKDVYTHYDLHGNNVLLYKPFNGNVYMKMHYHQPDGTVRTISSEWIVKLIDYGRNYFKTDSDSSTTLIQDILRASNCAKKRSVSIIKGKHDPPILDYIDPTMANPSHDLQLLKDTPAFLKSYFMDVDGINNKHFGFPPQESIPLDPSAQYFKIRNVTDVRKYMEISMMKTYMDRHATAKYENWECGGEMHIYPDGRPYTIQLHAVKDASVALSHSTIPRSPAQSTARPMVELDMETIKHQFLRLRAKMQESLVMMFTWISKVMIEWKTIHQDTIQDKYRHLLVYFLFLYCIQTMNNIATDTLQLYITACLSVIDAYDTADLKRLCMDTYSSKQIKDTSDALKRVFHSIEIKCIPELEYLLHEEEAMLNRSHVPEFVHKVVLILLQ